MSNELKTEYKEKAKKISSFIDEEVLANYLRLPNGKSFIGNYNDDSEFLVVEKDDNKLCVTNSNSCASFIRSVQVIDGKPMILESYFAMYPSYFYASYDLENDTVETGLDLNEMNIDENGITFIKNYRLGIYENLRFSAKMFDEGPFIVFNGLKNDGEYSIEYHPYNKSIYLAKDGELIRMLTDEEISFAVSLSKQHKKDKKLSINDSVLISIKDYRECLNALLSAKDEVLKSETNSEREAILNDAINRLTNLVTTYNQLYYLNDLSLVHAASQIKKVAARYEFYMRQKEFDLAKSEINNLMKKYMDIYMESEKQLFSDSQEESGNDSMKKNRK